jgi:hypothetical protein
MGKGRERGTKKDTRLKKEKKERTKFNTQRRNKI